MKTSVLREPNIVESQNPRCTRPSLKKEKQEWSGFAGCASTVVGSERALDAGSTPKVSVGDEVTRL